MQIQANADIYSHLSFLTTVKYFMNGTIIIFMLIRHVYVTCHQCIFNFHNSHEVGSIFPVLHMKKLKFKRAKTCPKFTHCWN